jgi:hypothetical protein
MRTTCHGFFAVPASSPVRANGAQWKLDGPVMTEQTWIDEPETEGELASLRRCILRGTPFGAESWVRRTAERPGTAIELAVVMWAEERGGHVRKRLPTPFLLS